MSSYAAYKNWIVFFACHLLLTLNFLTIKHYLLNKSARPPLLNLTHYLEDETASAALATPAQEQAIEQILDQLCRFLAANVVTASVAATVWFLVGYPSTLVWYETMVVAVLAPLFNFVEDSGLLLALTVILHQLFKTAWFAKTSRAMRKLLAVTASHSPKHHSTDHSPYRASALFLTCWLSSHLTRAVLSSQQVVVVVFGKPLLSPTTQPLNLYVYFGVTFALPLLIRRHLLERSQRKVISFKKLVYV